MDWALTVSVANSQENMGHLEEALMVEGRELQRQLLERAIQTKADNTPLRCPICGGALTRVTHDHERTVESRFGPVGLRRSRGWCRKCDAYYFPADFRLGLERSTASPGVQETAALLVSKMPAPEASAVLQRLTGQKISPASLEREARRQGQKAQKKRAELDGQLEDWSKLKQVAREARATLPEQPFVMVIELDAWNIRERDYWGQTQELQGAGQAFSRCESRQGLCRDYLAQGIWRFGRHRNPGRHLFAGAGEGRHPDDARLGFLLGWHQSMRHHHSQVRHGRATPAFSSSHPAR